MDANAWVELGLVIAAVGVPAAAALWRLGRDTGAIKAGMERLLDMHALSDRRMDRAEERIDEHGNRIARLEGRTH